MPRKQPQLAKLTRPRLHRAIERPRLFAVLDEAHDHKSAICVVGPPGAGKTTLVASWLDVRDINGIWYQVDPGDADLATFFYYLGEATKPFLRKRQRPLPLLTPEYLQDIDSFSRRFFRQLFSRLPEAATLVLDNYQEVEAAERFHEIVAQAVAEIAPLQSLIAISRRDPPDCYARLVANDNVCLVDWDDLRFTLHEVRAVMDARGVVPAADESDQWHRITGGWAAGLALMLEDRRRGGGAHTGAPVGRDAIFRYFASSIFSKVPKHIQRFLMITAHMPQVPVSVARALTARGDSGQILEDLYRHHLFTHRRPVQEETFWYHALFREFLKSQALVLLGQDECQEIMRQAAAILEARGDFDDAFLLYSEASDWPAVVRVVQDHAADLLAKGRGQTLRDWISALPAEYLFVNPRLRFWLGTSLIPVDQFRARGELEAAFEAFKGNEDIFGQLEAANRIVSTYYYEWSCFAPLDRWIGVLEGLIDSCSFYPTQEIEFDTYCSMLLAALYRRPDHPLLPTSVERVMAFLDSAMDLNRRVAGAIYLLSYAVLARADNVGARALAFVLPLLDHAELSPLNRVWVNARMGYFLYQVGRYEEARKQLERAEAAIESNGLMGLRSAARLIDSYWCNVLMGMRSFDLVRERQRKMQVFADSARPMDRYSVNDSQCSLCSATGDLSRLEFHARAALEAANAAGMPYVQAISHVYVCEVLAELGRYEQLEESLAEARLLIRGTCHEYFNAELDLIDAFACFGRGDQANAMDRLRRGMEHASRGNEPLRFLRHNHRVLGSVSAEALQRGLEIGYVEGLVRRYQIGPPDLCMESWPWHIKIRTLGTFELRVSGELVTFSGKAPKKPLAVLKVLAATGGRHASEARLIDALWPDEEADAAKKSLDITILRLRKLLGGDNTILVSEGLIGLNPKTCWVDAWAFERRCSECESGESDAGASVAAIELYGGSFLPNDSDKPWSAKMRERLRGKFIRLVESVAAGEEAAGHWERAIVLYGKGLEADDLVEAFYQGQMRSYRAMGRSAEAMGAYRKLRHLLSVVLGISPSESSQNLARALQENNRARI